MEQEIADIIAKNLVDLRKNKNLKQTDLADKIGYSDKAISRWENGSTVPDIGSLMILCKFYGVSLDDITKPNVIETLNPKEEILEEKTQKRNDIVILCLSVLTVWLIAVVVYVAAQIIYGKAPWLMFVPEVPVSAFFIFLYNHRHNRNRTVTVIMLSLIIWGIVAFVYLIYLKYNLWQLFIAPAPLEAMIIIYNCFGKSAKKNK